MSPAGQERRWLRIIGARETSRENSVCAFTGRPSKSANPKCGWRDSLSYRRARIA